MFNYGIFHSYMSKLSEGNRFSWHHELHLDAATFARLGKSRCCGVHADSRGHEQPPSLGGKGRSHLRWFGDLKCISYLLWSHHISPNFRCIFLRDGLVQKAIVVQHVVFLFWACCTIMETQQQINSQALNWKVTCFGFPDYPLVI